MASQNMDPAAASSAASLKGNETGASVPKGSVSKRYKLTDLSMPKVFQTEALFYEPSGPLCT